MRRAELDDEVVRFESHNVLHCSGDHSKRYETAIASEKRTGRRVAFWYGPARLARRNLLLCEPLLLSLRDLSKQLERRLLLLLLRRLPPVLDLVRYRLVPVAHFDRSERTPDKLEPAGRPRPKPGQSMDGAKGDGRTRIPSQTSSCSLLLMPSALRMHAVEAVPLVELAFGGGIGLAERASASP